MKTVFKGRAKVEISRFKGLGEMPPAQLRETTMDPAKRTLLRVTIPEAERQFTEQRVESLMGRKPELRLAFIQEHAQNALELDNLTDSREFQAIASLAAVASLCFWRAAIRWAFDGQRLHHGRRQQFSTVRLTAAGTNRDMWVIVTGSVPGADASLAATDTRRHAAPCRHHGAFHDATDHRREYKTVIVFNGPAAFKPAARAIRTTERDAVAG
jgi:hypothetical protein